MPSLEAVLQHVELDRYLGNFVEVGITAPQDLIHLTLEDYHTLGIDNIDDRKRLFQLIQKVKNGGDAALGIAMKERQQQPQPRSGGVNSGRRNEAKSEPHSNLPRPSGGKLPRPKTVQPPQTAPRGKRESSSSIKRPSTHSPASGALTDAPPPRKSFGRPSIPPPPTPSSSPSPASALVSAPAPSSTQSGFLSLAADLMKIRVAVRKRPLNSKEIKKKETDAMAMLDQQIMTVEEQKVKVDLTKYTETHQFNFDECIDTHCDHTEVYARTVRPLLAATFLGAKTTCFAYGQTGSGKTFTMQPLPMMAATDVVTALKSPEFSDLTVMVSVFEIYLSSVFDLLNERKRLVIREDSSKVVHIVGLEEREMESPQKLEEYLKIAEKARSSAPTHANAKSSRSHQVLQLALRRPDSTTLGKMSFIDLAGSEWGADIKDTNRQTRMEGAEINKSLLALKECIRALDRDAGHVPFRGSKLTEVLKDSFTGNSFTMMIACVSPASGSVEHSLNTLRYADRVKELQQPRDKSKPHVDRLTPGSLPNQREAGKRPVTSAPAPEPPTQMQPPTQLQAPTDAFEWSRTRSGSFVHRPENERDLVAETAQDEMLRQHDELIDTILEEEEQLLKDHRTEIEETMQLVKEDLRLLDMMDNPGTQVDDYVQQLDIVLRKKIEVVQGLRDKLKIFQEHLKQEDQMSKNFQHAYSRFY